MTSNPTKLALFRNVNDAVAAPPAASEPELGGGEEGTDEQLMNVGGVIRDEFGAGAPTEGYLESLGSPEATGGKQEVGSWEAKPPLFFPNGRRSRHEGSMRIKQRVALRATTAAPTIFRPVLMEGEFYVDGGVVCSNPAAVALHEANCLFP
jgi:hypothetical protein